MNIRAEEKPILSRIEARFSNLTIGASVRNVVPVSASSPFLHHAYREDVRSVNTLERALVVDCGRWPGNCTTSVSVAEAVAK